MRHSSSIFRPYPAQPYIFRILSVWAFQRCIVRLQQSSFRLDLPHRSSTVSLLRIEGNQSGPVIKQVQTPVYDQLVISTVRSGTWALIERGHAPRTWSLTSGATDLRWGKPTYMYRTTLL